MSRGDKMINGDIKLLTDEDIHNGASGTKVITNRNDYDLKSHWYVRGGLYDPLIYGSVGRCQCGKTTTTGIRCPVCKCTVVSDSEYMTNYGYYHLHVPYVSVIKVPGLISKLSEVIPGFNAKTIDDLWSYYYTIKYLPNVTKDDINTDDMNTGVYLSQNSYVYKLDITELPGDDVNEHPNAEYATEYAGLFGLSQLSDFVVINNNTNLKFIDAYINYNIIVPSPYHRQLSFYTPAGGNTVIKLPDYTLNFRALIDYNESIEYLMTDVYESLVDRMTLCWMMNMMVDKIMTSNNELLQSSKQSLGRNIVSMRMDKSIRANAVISYDIPMDQVKIPRNLAYIALQTDIIEVLRESTEKHTDAINMYLTKSPEALDALSDLVTNSMVTMVRNPSLHKYSMQAFHPILWDNVAIGVNPAVCKGYNLDFDGDQVYIQFYTSDLDCARVSSFTPDKLWFYDREYASLMVPSQEHLYGLCVATKLTEPDQVVSYESLDLAKNAYESGDLPVNAKCIIDGVETTYGRAYLSKCMNMDLNGFLGTGSINLKNIGKIIAAMGSHDDRVSEYKLMIDFANEVATGTGMGPLPYTELYKEDSTVVQSILDDPKDDPLTKQAKLRNYYEDVITDSIKELPDSNLDDLTNSCKKINVSSMSSIYAPMITGDSEVVVDGSSIFSGLSERQYTRSAEAGRNQLYAKRKLVPASGYDQRQLVNAQMSLIYKDTVGSPDTVGILLPAWLAIGRTDMNGNLITRVSANPSAKVRVKSCVATDTNIVYKDELGIHIADEVSSKYLGATDGKKFSLVNNSSIGIAFGTAITESITQNGLSFKHGGNLYNSLSIPIVTRESGTVTEITDTYVLVEGTNKYRYPLTNGCCIIPDISINSKVPKNKPIIKYTKIVGADDTLVKIDTILGLVVMGDVGQPTSNSISAYALNDGILSYDFNTSTFKIGDVQYPMDSDAVYYYPDGYKVTAGTRLSNSIPNMAYIVDKIGIDLAYYIFYDYMRSLDMFSNYTSEVFETLFKCIYKSGFSVKESINDKTSLIEKMYYGRGQGNITEAITNAKVVSESNEVITKLGDSILLPIILSNKTR